LNHSSLCGEAKAHRTLPRQQRIDHKIHGFVTVHSRPPCSRHNINNEQYLTSQRYVLSGGFHPAPRLIPESHSFRLLGDFGSLNKRIPLEALFRHFKAQQLPIFQTRPELPRLLKLFFTLFSTHVSACSIQ
ncbi:unnamed protein product, partial [Ixodes pacificus]